MYTPVFYSPTDSLLSGIRNDTSLVGIVLQLDANALNSYYVRLTTTIFTRDFTDFAFSQRVRQIIVGPRKRTNFTTVGRWAKIGLGETILTKSWIA